MNDEINYKNNPLHGVSLKALLTEMVDHYGFEILFAYLNINCFKTNPSIISSIKFLKKTDWAREKVEAFYLYEYKSLPRASSEQFSLPPRDRIVPEDQKPGEPAKLSLEDAERLAEKRAKKRPNLAGVRGVDPALVRVLVQEEVGGVLVEMLAAHARATTKRLALLVALPVLRALPLARKVMIHGGIGKKRPDPRFARFINFIRPRLRGE